ncbi:MAG: Hsp20/alpha crystallin family protein [Acidimicrobiales bacterium]
MTHQKADASPIAAATESKEVARHNEVQEWFDRWADQFGMRLPEFFGNRLPEFWGAYRGTGGVIRIEEITDDAGITVKGEIPGIDPEKDLEITVAGGRLSIAAERRETEERTEDGRYHSEFHYGSYRRSFQLPAGAETDKISATYDDGILTIRVPVDNDRTEQTRVQVRRSE